MACLGSRLNLFVNLHFMKIQDLCLYCQLAGEKKSKVNRFREKAEVDLPVKDCDYSFHLLHRNVLEHSSKVVLLRRDLQSLRLHFSSAINLVHFFQSCAGYRLGFPGRSFNFEIITVSYIKSYLKFNLFLIRILK